MTRTLDANGLSPASCLTRLERSRVGYLACTERALPCVVPVALQVEGTRVYLAVSSEREARLLAGQLVAVGAGKPAGVLRPGWQVIVRGELKPVVGEPRALVLDPRDIEGRTLHRSR